MCALISVLWRRSLSLSFSLSFLDRVYSSLFQPCTVYRVAHCLVTPAEVASERTKSERESELLLWALTAWAGAAQTAPNDVRKKHYQSLLPLMAYVSGVGGGDGGRFCKLRTVPLKTFKVHS